MLESTLLRALARVERRTIAGVLAEAIIDRAVQAGLCKRDADKVTLKGEKSPFVEPKDPDED